MSQTSRILIVDDDLMSAKMLGGILAAEAYELDYASNGPEAIEKVARFLPDLVLLDVMMAGMSGFTVCETIRADPAIAEVPIILITALDEQAARLKGIEAGADDFVSKPFDRVELRARIRTITRLNRYRRLLNERAERELATQELLHKTQTLAFLEKADQIKSTFITNISHELRTPLSAMTLYIDSLHQFYATLSDEDRRNMLHMLWKQMRKLNNLVAQILDIGQLDAEPRFVKYQAIDFVALMGEVVEQQAPFIQERQHTITIVGDERLLIWGDATMLNQVLTNLVTNAIKYTKNGGTITCECSHFTEGMRGLPIWPESDQLEGYDWTAVRISDTGLGIEQAHFEQIFERFYRANPQSNIPGTGLGLAIVKDIVACHAGYIGVTSAPGVGSTFAVYLPRDRT